MVRRFGSVKTSVELPRPPRFKSTHAVLLSPSTSSDGEAPSLMPNGLVTVTPMIGVMLVAEYKRTSESETVVVLDRAAVNTSWYASLDGGGAGGAGGD
eukprot:1861404-Prymnesium_polylepis.1